jgi:spermidine synthase
VASVAGSLVAGFVVIPRWGTDVLLASLGVILAVVGATAAWPLVASRRLRWGMATAATMVLLLALVGPRLRYQPLIAAVDFVYARGEEAPRTPPRFLYLEEGKTGVVSLAGYGGHRLRLQNNGLVESMLDASNPQMGSLPEMLLGQVPYLLHPDPRRAFVVGFGGGTTLRALLPTTLESVRVVELEPAVIDAVLDVFDAQQAGLADPRVRLKIDDARYDLLTHDARYDLVVAQPSHPWLAGASAVFTREYFELVRSRLTEHGICGQWINLFNMDATTLLSVGKAFFEVFPYGFTLALEPPRDLLLFGSVAPIEVDPSRIDERATALSPHRFFGQGDEATVDLLARFALSRAQVLALATNVEANDDLNILSEVRLASLDLRRYAGLGRTENPRTLLYDNLRYDLTGLELPWSDRDALDRIASRSLEVGSRQRARKAIASLMKIDPGRAQVLSDRLEGRARAPVD